MLSIGVTRVFGQFGFAWRYSYEAEVDAAHMGLAVLYLGTGQLFAAQAPVVPVLYALYCTVEKLPQ